MAKKNTSGCGRKLFRGIVIALVILLALCIAALAFVNAWLNQIQRFPADDPDSTSATGETAEATESTTIPMEFDENDHLINVLLIGQDRREGQTDQRSDAMILCSLNRDNNTLTMTSFMRDMYLEIPGHGEQRINKAYEWGGHELLEQTISYHFDIQIDHSVEVDFFAFQKIIDQIGGVEIELTKKEADYLNRRGNWDVEPETAGTWNLTEGVNLLNGSQALAFSRIRDIGDDFQRTARQRTVLNVLFNRAKNQNFLELYQMLNTLLPLLITDMTNAEIFGYMFNLLPILDQVTVSTLRIPADGLWWDETIKGMMVIVADIDSNKQLLFEALGIE